MSDRLVPLGKIVTTHGITGWLKLDPYNLQSSLLSRNGTVILEKDGARAPFELESSRLHRRQVLLKLGGIDTIDEARLWVGSVLGVAEKRLDTPAPGEYYHYQVAGFEVIDIAGAHIGVVKAIWSTPAGELYVVAAGDKEHLIPAVKEIVETVDLESRTLVINPPPGLLDL